MRPKRAILACVAAVAAFSQICPALAQVENYPGRVIHVVVGFAPGGGNDLFARLVNPLFEKYIGGTAIIENRPGAGGRLSSNYVAHQPADGYTILVGATGQMSIAAAIYPQLGYHPTKSFIPLAMIASYPLVLVVPADRPIKTLQDLIGWAKANPDKSNYATSSPSFTIATELFKLTSGMPGQAIPYKSSSESNLSVVAGQTLFTISDGPPAIPLVKGGKTHALAVTGSERSPQLPNVPSMAEAGLPQVNTQLWSGYFVPTGTPAPIVEKLKAALSAAIADAGVAAKLRMMGVKPGGPSGDEFRKRIDDDIASFSEIVKAAKLKFEQ